MLSGMNCVFYCIGGNIVEPLGMKRVTYGMGGNRMEQCVMEHVKFAAVH